MKAVIYTLLRTGFTIALVTLFTKFLYSRGWLNWTVVFLLVLLVVVWDVVDRIKKGYRQ